MLKYLSGVRASYKLSALGILVIILLGLMGTALLRWASSDSNDRVALKITYCGSSPEELCILSFSRDLEENMVINLFVPDPDFPDFYLKIKRAAAESVYECQKSEEVPSDVYCFGPLIGLQEKMEISLISKADDQLLASGKLTLLAVLLSPMQGAALPPVSAASEPNLRATVTPVPTVVFQTAIPTFVFATATVTPTPTLISYP